MTKNVLTVLLALGLGALWVWSNGAELRAIRGMPESERHAFYERTLRNLASVCTDPIAADLEEFCQEEAARALLFPECDGRCRELARRILPISVK